MIEQIISFDTALLAKEKGFKHLGRGYVADGSRLERPKGYAEIPASTQSVLAKWLREVHNVFVSVSYDHIRCNGTYFIWFGNMGKNCNQKEDFASFEEAFEEGLIEALNLI